ncbi:MAG TPA: hypothetical protein ENG36_03315, partial [Lentisphaerae bacterium]|nr:hypothetical protein [Lentisphaerota bacterium]
MTAGHYTRDSGRRRRWRRPALPVGVVILDWTALALTGLGIGAGLVFFGGAPRWSYSLTVLLVLAGALVWSLRCFVERVSGGWNDEKLLFLWLLLPLGYWWLRGWFSPVRVAAWHELVLLG